jgi:FAD-linked oxidoreductase
MMTTEWKNWSGSVQARPMQFAKPRTEDELAAVVRAASKVRVVGAGHSFMPLCATDGVLLELSELDSPLEIAADGKTAWAPAGWSLRRLTDAMWKQGYSLINQGDVNPQSLAGAISTGTHGTGAELGSLATAARAFRVMLADGSVVECSPDERPQMFEAQRLSLGLLGVVTRIKVDILPAYHLEERIERVPFAEVLERFDSLAASMRHAEFFIFPYTDQVILKTLHPTEADEVAAHTADDDEKIFRFICSVCASVPSLTGVLQRQLVKFIRGSRRVGPAYKIFPSERTVQFEEMEYEMPRAAGLSTLQEVIKWIRRKRLPVTFPFEFRCVAADDIWLSPFNRGPGASISMHQYAPMPWQQLFADAEAIFRSHGGRPHWAKRHTLTSKDVYDLYPQAAMFAAVRSDLDPQAKFANAHLMQLFDVTF